MKKYFLFYLFLIVFLAIACGGEKFPLPEQAIDFTATLDAEQQVPAVAVQSEGTGEGVFSLNADGTELSYNIVVSVPSLTGPITNAHFHNGPAGVAEADGPVRNLFADFTNGVATGTWRSDEVVQPLTPTLVAELLAGNIYVDIHTAANEPGEIRGQIGGATAVNDTIYLQLNPVWEPATGYD